MRNAFLLLYCLLFFMISIVPLALMPLFRDQPTYDNRFLAEKPALFVDGKPNEEFAGQFEAWFSDHFAMRPYVVTAYNLLYLVAFGESKQDNVVVGKNDWLYFSETLDDYVGLQTLSQEDINDISSIISLCDEYLQAQGKGFIFFSPPNKNTIYPEYMPKRYRRSDAVGNAALLHKGLAENGVTFIDIHELIKTAVKSSHAGEIYYHKKDSHWNNLGAVMAYESLMQEVNRYTDEPFQHYQDRHVAAEESHEGDLEGMLLPALGRKDIQYNFGVEPDYISKKPIQRYDAMEIVTYSEQHTAKALMFRDSFANALIPFLSNQFGEIKYTRALPYNLTEADFADVVIMEIVERNIPELLLRAPVMAAPMRSSAVNAREMPNTGAKAYVEEKYGLYYVYGYVPYHEDALESILIECPPGGATYEAFPIIDARMVEDAVNVRGFAFYLEENPDTDRIDVLLTGQEPVKISSIPLAESPEEE